MLEKYFECNNENYACEHGDAHGPVVTRLTICIQRILKNLCNNEESDDSFIETSYQPPKKCILIE